MKLEWLEHSLVWLAKANSDLSTARLVISGPEKYLDTGVYHCQQAAEKALKAWLTAQGVVFPKTHVLEALLDLALPSNPNFEAFRKHAEELTPLATEFRYPGDIFAPSLQLACHALSLAQDLLEFVTSALSEIPKSSDVKTGQGTNTQ
jgi:HEPN domain-containing protein